MMGAAVAFTYAGSVEKANELVRTIESTGGRALAIQADKCRPRRGQECRRRDVKQFRRTGHSC
jgi:3-oxoacyl-[acyl-carrier protein] reductase